jgi:aspartate/methionine/tyrosine aminotransferase
MFSRRTAWNLATNRYTEALKEHDGKGRELLDLTASNPTTIGLTFDGEKILEGLTVRDALTYRPMPKGLLSAREAIVEYYAERGGHLHPDDLILTTSTSEGYSFVFRLLCDPGDTVLVPAPSYPLFDFLAELNDVELAPYELVYDHGWQIDFQSIQQAIEYAASQSARCRAVLVVHPNNPTGSYVKPHEVAELSRICASHEMAIVADEVFLDYALGDQPPPHTFSSGQDALTFTLSGLSKIAALPQMKVAWIVTSGPDSQKSEALARLEVIADTYLSMNAPIQHAISAMLEERRSIHSQLMGRIKSNLASLDKNIAQQTLCQRLALEGGWYAILRVPNLGSDEDLVITLLREADVLLQPGHFYNFSTDGYLIASLITPEDQFAEGIERTLRYIAGH